MGTQLQLQAKLVEIQGNNNVYFQPPSNITMKYPCIVYERSRQQTRHANDKPYMQMWGYVVTVIDANPNSQIVEVLSKLPLCGFSRHFKADNLNHDVFDLYF